MYQYLTIIDKRNECPTQHSILMDYKASIIKSNMFPVVRFV